MKVIKYIGQLPQCLLGLLLIRIMRLELKETVNDIKIYSGPKMSGGISLGNYILLSPYSYKSLDTIKHEYGHTRQSLYLGWLYLPTVGLLSLLWAGFIHDVFFPNKSYYGFFVEAWANKLGNV